MAHDPTNFLTEKAEREAKEKADRKQLKEQQRARMVKAFEKIADHLETIARHYERQAPGTWGNYNHNQWPGM